MCSCNQSWVQIALIIVGGAFALIQWGRSLRGSRSHFVQDKIKALLEDEIQEVLACQDSCEANWLEERIGQDDGAGKLADVNFETKVRKVLCVLDELSHLYFIGNIAESDLKLFLPVLLRIVSDKQISKYLVRQRTDYEERVEKKELPYLYLVLLGKLYGVDSSEFSDYKFTAIGRVILGLRRFLSKTLSLTVSCGHGDVHNRVNSVKEKIGVLVVGDFKRCIVERGEKDETVVKNLTDRRYSRLHFGLSYAVLMEAGEVNVHLNRRYYVDGFMIRGKTFRLCNNWFERQRDNIMRWISQGQ